MRIRCWPGRGALAFAVAMAATLPSCGYSTGSLFDPGYRKVHLPVFGNETFYRDLEIALTRDVQRELASRPGIFIVPRDEADIVLQGTIVDFQQRVLSEDDRDRVRESSALTRVRVEVRNPRSGTVVKQYVVADRAEFFTARGENLATATSESFRDLARKVVQALEEDFPRSSVPESDDDMREDTPDV